MAKSIKFGDLSAYHFRHTLTVRQSPSVPPGEIWFFDDLPNVAAVNSEKEAQQVLDLLKEAGWVKPDATLEG